MPDDPNGDIQARLLWSAYARAAGLRKKTPAMIRFGDSEELADELAAQVIAGSKRAHASLPRDFRKPGRRLPKSGDFGVVVDGRGTPLCVVRCVAVEVKPMDEVDEHFAWADGGGNRSLEWWISAHTRYFRRQGAREGFSVGGDTKVVLERFEVVWPPELADAQAPSPGTR